MKLIANCMLRTFLSCLIAVSHLPCDSAKALGNGSNKYEATADAQQNSLRHNDTVVTALPAQTKPLDYVQASLVHIRKKREMELVMPFDHHTLHLPCDFDFRVSSSNTVVFFPNHCLWVLNMKFTHEGAYRVYKTYQIEGFFFGQYYERLRRFEMDPHSWDYSNVGV